jgi:hypothetical protein
MGQIKRDTPALQRWEFVGQASNQPTVKNLYAHRTSKMPRNLIDDLVTTSERTRAMIMDNRNIYIYIYSISRKVFALIVVLRRLNYIWRTHSVSQNTYVIIFPGDGVLGFRKTWGFPLHFSLYYFRNQTVPPSYLIACH